jgi:dipeptidyl aminopeptidase/acylaminoacyl peptidase
MDFFEASLARRHQLRFPSDPSLTRDSTAVVAAVRPAAHERRQSSQSRVWCFSLDGAEAALPERGVESELVAYPREGHGQRERDHQLDAWRRTVGWFDRYLESPR